MTNSTTKEGPCHCGNGVWSRAVGNDLGDACTRCGCFFKQPITCNRKSRKESQLEADIARHKANDKALADAGIAEEHPLRQLEIKRAKVATVLLRRLRGEVK